MNRFTSHWAMVAMVAFAIAPAASASARVGPHTTEFDSLLVSATNSNDVLLGTQHGLFATTDGGHSWKPAGLNAEAVTGLVRAGSSILASGKGLLAKSVDGGRSWVRLNPKGLPNEDISALTVDPSRPSRVYVVLDSAGLYRSVDGLQSFRIVSFTVGPAVKALATAAHVIIAGDVVSGIYLSSDGQNWRRTAGGMVMGLAVNLNDPKQVLAASYGISRSKDGGLRWGVVKHSRTMFGAVAWAPSTPSLAYAVGDDRSFWRSTDAGVHWSRITAYDARAA